MTSAYLCLQLLPQLQRAQEKGCQAWRLFLTWGITSIALRSKFQDQCLRPCAEAICDVHICMDIHSINQLNMTGMNIAPK
jgi:hypothetical protein